MRQQVAMALGEFDGPEAAEALAGLLVDPERIVAQAAADSMAELKDPACADVILPLVRHAHAFVRIGALRALKELRRKDTLKPALEALHDHDAAVRVQAIGVIGFLKLEESIPALTALIGDPDAHVRRAAVSALAFSQMKSAAETITRALKDEDWMVREMAAETLGLNANGALAADQLISCVVDAFWQVRLKAIRSLGRMKIDRAVRPIGSCVSHEQANLRKEAAAALGEIASVDGEPFLAMIANDPDPDVRKNARWALQQIAARKAKAGS
ncbi:HEAT repeat domain-containing protein [Bradyrhizobium sp. WSM 1738]|nr:HEAT repeat domain-containing protein [Bradyrhizobium hereditatis]